MRKLKAEIFAILLAGFVSATGYAQNTDLIGDWDIVTHGFSIGGTTSHVDVTLEAQGDKVVAWVYDGPADVRVSGNEFAFDLHWATGWDTEHLSTFSGKINALGRLEGEVDHNGAIDFLGKPMKGGKFSGSRAVDRIVSDDLPPEPVDLQGVWRRAFGKGAIRKLDYAMTPQGQATIDSYLEMDNGNSRCVSMGVVMASGMPYPMEIINGEDHIVVMYGADYVRRIYLDGREFPDSATSSSLGFSSGEWQGQTLVVTTTHLNPAFMSTRGQPISANAYTIEHFFMDDKGYLHADMWLHDAKNYTRVPYLRRVLDRDFSPSVITKIGCDPYSFFRALHLEGQLDEFWDRSALRR